VSVQNKESRGRKKGTSNLLDAERAVAADRAGIPAFPDATATRPARRLNLVVRGYSKAAMLVIDEAARVPDDLYRAVRPMLAVSQGRLLALSTHFGQQSWFDREWEGAGSDWQRVCATGHDCPRISPDLIEREPRSLG
jgi:hypothetical protein